AERLVCSEVAPDAADQTDVRAEQLARDRLVATLSAGNPLERRAAHRLTRTRQPLDPCHEVEIDGADNGQTRGHGAIVSCAGWNGRSRRRSSSSSAPPHRSTPSSPSSIPAPSAKAFPFT